MNETRMSKPVKWTLSETYGINDRLFQRLQSRLNAAERTFRRCLQDLKKLQVERPLRPRNLLLTRAATARERPRAPHNHKSPNEININWLRSTNQFRKLPKGCLQPPSPHPQAPTSPIPRPLNRSTPIP